MHKRQIKVLLMLLLVIGMSGCLRAVIPATDSVPCVSIKPLSDGLRAALIPHPETPRTVGVAAVKVIGATEAVCQ